MRQYQDDGHAVLRAGEREPPAGCEVRPLHFGDHEACRAGDDRFLGCPECSLPIACLHRQAKACGTARKGGVRNLAAVTRNRCLPDPYPRTRKALSDDGQQEPRCGSTLAAGPFRDLVQARLAEPEWKLCPRRRQWRHGSDKAFCFEGREIHVSFVLRNRRQGSDVPCGTRRQASQADGPCVSAFRPVMANGAEARNVQVM